MVLGLSLLFAAELAREPALALVAARGLCRLLGGLTLQHRRHALTRYGGLALGAVRWGSRWLLLVSLDLVQGQVVLWLLRLVETDAVVVVRLWAPGRRPAFDRAVVATSRVGLIANLIRMPATLGRRGDGLVRSVLMRQVVTVGYTARPAAMVHVLRLTMHPRGTLAAGVTSVAVVTLLLEPVHAIHAASTLCRRLVQAKLCALWPERYRAAAVETIRAAPRLRGSRVMAVSATPIAGEVRVRSHHGPALVAAFNSIIEAADGFEGSFPAMSGWVRVIGLLYHVAICVLMLHGSQRRE